MGTNKNHSNVRRTQTHYGVTWIDIENPSEATLSELERDFQLHPLHLSESIQKVQVNQVEREDNYLFLLLHLPIHQRPTEKILVGRVGVFLGSDYLITIHKESYPLVTDLFELIEGSPAHADESFKKGAGYLLYIVIQQMLADVTGLSQSVLNELDDIEDVVFDNTGSDAYRIGKVRQKIVRIKRVVDSLKIVLDDLTQQINTFTGEHLTKYYANNTKTINRLWEVIEEAKETVEIYKDADFTTSTEQTNRILAVLTLVFTFTIPVSVVGALYGMNVPLPGGSQTGEWTFLGTYTTFIVLLALSSLTAYGMYRYCKIKKWF